MFSAHCRLYFFTLAAIALLATSCGPERKIDQVTRDADSKKEASNPAVPDRAAALFRNLPVNSDQQCVGIAAVAESLLEGQVLAGDCHQTPAALADKIYASLVDGVRLQYCPLLELGNARSPVDSSESLAALMTLVADKYKADYQAAMATDEGQQRLTAAALAIVESRENLEQILEADHDHIELFCASGKRRFPDGSVLDTHHAFLMARLPSAQFVIYDPNDPRKPIECALLDTEGGLQVEWTCQYRDTGEVTTQRYGNLVSKENYFPPAFSRKARSR